MLSNLSPIKKLVLGLAVMCIIVSVITANNLASVMMLVAARNNSQNNNSQAVVQQAPQQSVQNNVSNNNANNTPSTNNTPSADTNKPADDTNKPADDANKPADDANKPADDANKGGEKSVAEIADMYNKAVNNAKANATITRVKDGATNYNNIVEAGKLSSAASTLMGMFMVGSKDEIQAKNEPWDNNKFPPENAQAALTADGIASAECKEEGDYYILTIKGKDEVNPKSGGNGVGSLCGVIQEETITGSISSVPGLTLSDISIAYENVVTVAKIEKSTGNLVELIVEAPCILSLSAKLTVISIDNAKVGIGVYTEYSLAY